MLGKQQTTTDQVMPSAPVESSFKALQRLRRACRIALEHYVDIASLSSGELARLNPGAIDQLSRTNLALLRQKEQRAHEAYLDARERLLEFVLAGGRSGNPAGNPDVQ